MFKTITVIKLADKQTLNLMSPESLTEAIPEPTVVDPDKTQWGRYGFAATFGGKPVFVAADQTRMLTVQLRERILPGAVIRKAVKERAEEIAERQGYKCNKKQLAEIKDFVTSELLATSHIKQTDIACMVTGEYLIIGTGSATKIDDCLAMFRGLFEDGLNFKHIATDKLPVTFMKELLLDESTDSGDFNCGDSVVLKNESKGTVRIKDINLESVDVDRRIGDGFQPVELSIWAGERMHFAMSDHMVFKRIKFSDVLLKGVEEDSQGDSAAQFEGTVALVAGELKAMLNNLLFFIPSVERKEEKPAPDDDDEL